MLRRILLASAAATALSGAARAADLPLAAPPPPVATWTGLYIGENAGYNWAASRSVNTRAVPVSAPGLVFGTELALSSALATGSAPVNQSGFIGGGQIGYNYQLANTFVAGFEVDFQGIAGNHPSGSFSGSGVPAGFPGETIVSTVTSSKRLDYLGTVRGRLGYLVTPTLLVYGTGGFAYGRAHSSTSISQDNTGTGVPDVAPFGASGSFSNSRVGWTAGGGGEWLFWPRWSIKVEYLYYDLGRATYALSPLAFSSSTLGLLYASAPFASTRFNGNIVRAGLNFHF